MTDQPDVPAEALEDLDTEEEGNVIEDLDEAAADLMGRDVPADERHDEEVDPDGE